MKGRCSRCKKRLTSENASASVVSGGYGRCRVCENEHAKKRSRTLGGKYNLGSAQAKFNGHKWDLSFQQYAAIVAFDECFYCGGLLPRAAGGLDREENGDYTWDYQNHRVAESSLGLRFCEVATKSKAVKLHQLCYSRADGMKNTGSCRQNRISLTNCNSSSLNQTAHTRLFVVWIQRDSRN